MYEHIRNVPTINRTQCFIPKIKPENNIMSITLIETRADTAPSKGVLKWKKCSNLGDLQCFEEFLCKERNHERKLSLE